MVILKMKINHPLKGCIDFEPYDYQKELIQKLVHENKNVIVKSARQMGVSTTLFYCIRELCLTQPNYKAILITSNGYGYNGLNGFPDSDRIKQRNKFKIEYDNGSEIIFLPGYSINGKILNDYKIFIDLYEFVDGKFMISLREHFSSNNFNPKFYSFTGNNNFEKDKFEILKWNWDMHPERDQSWFDCHSKLFGRTAELELIVE